jgi:hypothetical protein
MSWDQEQPGQSGQPGQPEHNPGEPEPTAAFGPADQQQWGTPGAYPQQPQQQPFGQPMQPPQPPPFGQPSQPYGGWPQPTDPAAYQQYPGYAPYQPPKPKHTGLYVGLGIGAVVVAAGVAVAVALSGSSPSTSSAASGSSASTQASTATTPSAGTDTGTPTDNNTATQATQTTHTVTVPATAGSLHLLTNSDTAARISSLKSKLAGNAVYANPQIGFYGVGSKTTYSVWMLAETTTDIPSFQQQVANFGDAATAQSLATGTKMTSIETVDAGPLGGAMRCGLLTQSGVTVRTCVWVDDSTFGWFYALPSVSRSDAITYAQELRAAAEQ